MKKLTYKVFLLITSLVGYSNAMKYSLPANFFKQPNFETKVRTLLEEGVTLPKVPFPHMNDQKVLELLAEAKSNNSSQDLIQRILDARDPSRGWTVLHYAAENGDVDAVKQLLSYGADMFARANLPAFGSSDFTTRGGASPIGVSAYNIAVTNQSDQNVAEVLKILNQYHAKKASEQNDEE